MCIMMNFGKTKNYTIMDIMDINYVLYVHYLVFLKKVD